MEWANWIQLRINNIFLFVRCFYTGTCMRNTISYKFILKKIKNRHEKRRELPECYTMRHSRPFRPSCDPHYFFFFSSKYVMDGHKKKWLTIIFRFFWNFLLQQWSKSSWNSGRYRFFWNLHHKFFDEKENFWNQFHHFQSFILGSTTKIKKIKMIFLPTWL